MPASRKRGGAKAHRKRVNKVNNQRQLQQTAMQKLFNEALKKQIEDLKNKKEAESGATESK